jgi:hypothetical protein
MALANKLFGQIGNDPFGAPVQSWRASLQERRNLGDFHRKNLPPFKRNMDNEKAALNMCCLPDSTDTAIPWPGIDPGHPFDG